MTLLYRNKIYVLLNRDNWCHPHGTPPPSPWPNLGVPKTLSMYKKINKQR